MKAYNQAGVFASSCMSLVLDGVRWKSLLKHVTKTLKCVSMLFWNVVSVAFGYCVLRACVQQLKSVNESLLES